MSFISVMRLGQKIGPVEPGSYVGLQFCGHTGARFEVLLDFETLAKIVEAAAEHLPAPVAKDRVPELMAALHDTQKWLAKLAADHGGDYIAQRAMKVHDRNAELLKTCGQLRPGKGT